jgi:hypothetical protein
MAHAARVTSRASADAKLSAGSASSIVPAQEFLHGPSAAAARRRRSEGKKMMNWRWTHPQMRADAARNVSPAERVARAGTRVGDGD